jgi:hypothetical protein
MSIGQKFSFEIKKIKKSEVDIFSSEKRALSAYSYLKIV